MKTFSQAIGSWYTSTTTKTYLWLPNHVNVDTHVDVNVVVTVDRQKRVNVDIHVVVVTIGTMGHILQNADFLTCPWTLTNLLASVQNKIGRITYWFPKQLLHNRMLWRQWRRYWTGECIFLRFGQMAGKIFNFFNNLIVRKKHYKNMHLRKSLTSRLS